VRSFSLAHKSDVALSHDTPQFLFREDSHTADALAHIGEFDARKLYRQAGYDTMHEYLIRACNRSEDAAYDRVQAARCARTFPTMFEMLADGRLHLAGILLLAPYLTQQNAAELLQASARASKRGIVAMLAARFPRTESLPLVTAIPDLKFGPGRIESPANGLPFGPGRNQRTEPRTKIEPIAQRRFLLQVSIGQDTHDLLQTAQELLSHAVPRGEIAEVLQRALQLLVTELAKQKYAVTKKSAPARASRQARRIPAHVRRAVYERDGGQCTFVSESGRRCRSRKFVEFDHVQAVAHGGEATVENVRLRCRAHNQLAAEQAFGAEFMKKKRGAARDRRACDVRAPA